MNITYVSVYLYAVFFVLDFSFLISNCFNFSISFESCSWLMPLDKQDETTWSKLTFRPSKSKSARAESCLLISKRNPTRRLQLSAKEIARRIDSDCFLEHVFSSFCLIVASRIPRPHSAAAIVDVRLLFVSILECWLFWRTSCRPTDRRLSRGKVGHCIGEFCYSATNRFDNLRRETQFREKFYKSPCLFFSL